MVQFPHILYKCVLNQIFADAKTEGISVPNLLTDKFYTPTTHPWPIHIAIWYVRSGCVSPRYGLAMGVCSWWVFVWLWATELYTSVPTIVAGANLRFQLFALFLLASEPVHMKFGEHHLGHWV